MQPSTPLPGRFPIIGIGASAGGLQALEEFLHQVPVNPPAAFIIVQHLSPQHGSSLPGLLGRSTAVPVEQIRDGTRVVRGHAYVIPPDATVTIEDGVLHLRSPRESHFPIDSLFVSLAKDQGANAICILLSGGGTDGTLGLRAIKEYGGMALAQTLESAGFDPLLRSAIATGLVDHVLAPGQMWAQLLTYWYHAGQPREADALEPTHLAAIHDLLQLRSGNDFRLYKENTVQRRLERRMNISHTETTGQYLALLDREPTEVDALFRDLLVGMTQFFRDPEAFAYLGEQVVPRLFAGKGPNDEVRVWVMGCASGEEAYSIAMLLHEHLATLANPPRLKVFASDIDERRLAVARKACYAESVAEQVSPARVARFFNRVDGCLQVKREIREHCIFASHNVTQDPPFTRLDLVVCRNVMIYMQANLQRRLMLMFHHSLRPTGYLFLGSAEDVTGNGDHFLPINARFSVFQRIDIPSTFQFPISVPTGPTWSSEPERPTPNGHEAMDSKSHPPSAAPPSTANREAEVAPDHQGTASVPPGDADSLQAEMGTLRDQLRSSREELRATQIDLRSTSEEYQSSSEELEASREELHSYNEELQTLNTELNRKVAELDQANGDLRNLLDSTQIATVFLTRDLRIRSYTTSAQRLFPLTPGDVGRPITDLAALFSCTWLAEDIAAVLATETVHQQVVTPASGGRYRLSMLPYRTAGGAVEGALLTFVDITELQQSRDEADSARRFAEDIVNTVREPLLVLDAALQVRSANQAFYAAFQVDAEATLGKTLYDLNQKRWDVPPLRKLMSELLPQKKTVENFLVEVERDATDKRTFLLNARQVDHVPLILLAMEDITERQRTEDQLREANDHLTHFSYAMSHDLQEPLRMTVSYSQLLARTYRGQLDARADQYIDFAVDGALRMEALLKGMREYWTTQNTDHTPTAPCDANRAVEEAIRMLALLIKERNATITHDVLPTVAVEEVSLILLLQNLISNAIKYAREDEAPQVHITASPQDDQWRIAVRDNGIGIEASAQEDIFLPFRRLHGDETPGTGLGLTNARNIVTKHGGTLTVESTVGQGSTFIFTAPAASEAP